MFGHLGAFEIILIIFVIILLFGAKKIPDLFKGVGKGIKEFKKGLNEDEDQLEKKDRQ